MKLSTKGRYGIHAMYDLALHAQSGPQPIKAIAERQNVPEAYLEQLFGQLRRAGLVLSTRGSQGGYTLSRPAAEISVGDVLRVVEGPLAITDCLSDEALCDRACRCPTRVVWQKVSDALESAVDGISLQDMADDALRSAETAE